jgi:hypothetical protein
MESMSNEDEDLKESSICPRCYSCNIAYIRYGYFIENLHEEWEKILKRYSKDVDDAKTDYKDDSESWVKVDSQGRKYVLGGCYVRGENNHCLDCGCEW